MTVSHQMAAPLDTAPTRDLNPSPLSLLMHLLTACVAITVAMALDFGHPNNTARVVEIDSDIALRQFVTTLGDVDELIIKERSRAFLQAMQITLDSFAAQNGVIVVDTKLTIAGAVDITERAYTEALAAMSRIEVVQ